MCVIDLSPTLETRRLLLRAPALTDAAVITRLCGDADVARNTARIPHPYRREDAEAFLERVSWADPRRDPVFIIEHQDEGPVGMIGFHYNGDPWPELGYWIGKPWWGRGFATEATQAALDWASRRWNRRAVMAGHFRDNPASGAVLTKAGFLYTGEIRSMDSLARGEPVEVRMMVWLA